MMGVLIDPHNHSHIFKEGHRQGVLWNQSKQQRSYVESYGYSFHKS